MINKKGDDMYIWNSIKELYEVLIQMPDIHSSPTINGNVLYWDLFEDAYIRAYCNDKDFYIEIVGVSLSNSGSVRWLTDKNSMLQELYSLGKKGNMCVIKKTLLGSRVFIWAIRHYTHFPIDELGILGRKNMTLVH